MLLAFAFLWLLPWLTSSCEPIAKRQFVIAHRGFSGRYPEQTMASYEAAVFEESAQYLECDLQFTKDNIFICSHDPNLIETTDVQRLEEFLGRYTSYLIDGKIQHGYFAIDFTLEEISRMRTMQRYGFRNQEMNGRFPVAPLDDLLDFATTINEQCQGEGVRLSCEQVGLYLELKHPSWYLSRGFDVASSLLRKLESRGLIKPLQNEFRSTSLTNAFPVFLQSFEAWQLMAIRAAIGSPLQLTALVLYEDFSSGYGSMYDRKRTGNETEFEIELVEANLNWISTFADAVGPDKRLLLNCSDGSTSGITNNRPDYVKLSDIQVLIIIAEKYITVVFHKMIGILANIN